MTGGNGGEPAYSVRSTGVHEHPGATLGQPGLPRSAEIANEEFPADSLALTGILQTGRGAAETVLASLNLTPRLQVRVLRGPSQ